MTKEELIKVIKDEVAINGNVQFAVDLWDGDGYNVQNGMFTDEYVIRDINGMQVKETYDEIDEEVLENCYECRVTMEILFNNARLNTQNDKFLMVTILEDMLSSKIGEDSVDINIKDGGNHYDEVFFDDNRYQVSFHYYNEDGQEETDCTDLSLLDIDMLAAIFRQINK